MSLLRSFYPGIVGAQGAANIPLILGTPSTFTPTAADPHNLSYTLPSNEADRLVVAVYDDIGITVTTVTWTATGASGQSLTQRSVSANGNTSVELWDVTSPNFGTSAGAGTLSVDRSASNVVGVVVYALKGAHTDAPVIAFQSGGSISAPSPSPLAIDPEPNSRILHLVCHDASTIGITFDGSESVDVLGNTSQCRFGASNKTSASGAVTSVDWEPAATVARWAQIAASYKTASAPVLSTISFDGDQNFQNFNTAAASWSGSRTFTTATNLLVAITSYEQNTPVNSVVIEPAGANIPLTQVGSVVGSGGQSRVAIWEAHNFTPLTGSKPVVVTFDGVTNASGSLGLWGFKDAVKVIGPGDFSFTGAGSGTSNTGSITPGLDEQAGFILAGLNVNLLETVTPGGGLLAALHTNTGAAGGHSCVFSHNLGPLTGAQSPSFSWTTSSRHAGGYVLVA